MVWHFTPASYSSTDFSSLLYENEVSAFCETAVFGMFYIIFFCWLSTKGFALSLKWIIPLSYYNCCFLKKKKIEKKIIYQSSWCRAVFIPWQFGWKLDWSLAENCIIGHMVNQSKSSHWKMEKLFWQGWPKRAQKGSVSCKSFEDFYVRGSANLCKVGGVLLGRFEWGQCYWYVGLGLLQCCDNLYLQGLINSPEMRSQQHTEDTVLSLVRSNRFIVGSNQALDH